METLLYIDILCVTPTYIYQCGDFFYVVDKTKFVSLLSLDFFFREPRIGFDSPSVAPFFSCFSLSQRTKDCPSVIPFLCVFLFTEDQGLPSVILFFLVFLSHRESEIAPVLHLFFFFLEDPKLPPVLPFFLLSLSHKGPRIKSQLCQILFRVLKSHDSAYLNFNRAIYCLRSMLILKRLI